MNEYIIKFSTLGDKDECEIIDVAPSKAIEKFKNHHPYSTILEIKKKR